MSAGALDQCNVVDETQSHVLDYYNGRSVLVTGASGFLGKLIVEKLLRTCRGINKIFVLIRPKGGQTSRERLDKLFESVIFDRLRGSASSTSAGAAGAVATNDDKQEKDKPSSLFEQLKKKVVLLQGNLTEPNLGLNIERLLQLADETSVILHSAALVSFDGKLRRSVDTNLIGTKNVLDLACKLHKLSAFVHVSTCYSNSYLEEISEHIYPVNLEPKSLIELTETLDDDALDLLKPELFGSHPNQYTYTKQLTEYLCAQYGSGAQQLPLLICRPSIIIATYEEPFRAYLDNRNAGNGMFESISRGLMRVAHGSETSFMDNIPADFVSNCVISLAWFADLYHRVRLVKDPSSSLPYARCQPISKTEIKSKLLERRMTDFYLERRDEMRVVASKLNLHESLMQVPVVHVSSGVENPITWARMFKLIAKHTCDFPSSDLFRLPRCPMFKSYILYKFAAFIYLTFIGHFFDWFSAEPKQQVGRRPSDWRREFLRAQKLNQVLHYFMKRTFRFEPINRLRLINHFMNAEDRHLFNCDVNRISWDSFARDLVVGIRKYLIGENEDNLAESRSKFRLKLVRNTLIQLALVSISLYVVLWYSINGIS